MADGGKGAREGRKSAAKRGGTEVELGVGAMKSWDLRDAHPGKGAVIKLEGKVNHYDFERPDS
jgi:hypothetical protein